MLHTEKTYDGKLALKAEFQAEGGRQERGRQNEKRRPTERKGVWGLLSTDLAPDTFSHPFVSTAASLWNGHCSHLKDDRTEAPKGAGIV